MQASPPSAVTPLALLGLVGITAYVGALAWAMSTTQYAVWGAILVIPVIIGLNVPLLTRAARTEGERVAWRPPGVGVRGEDPGAFAWYWMVYGLYGTGDSIAYTDYAEEQSILWRTARSSTTTRWRLDRWHVLPPLGHDSGLHVHGTVPVGRLCRIRHLQLLGAVPALSLISCPEFDWLHAALIFFLPSLLFWPSSVGKEAFLMLCLGPPLGAARLFQHDLGGIPLLVAGLAGSTMVRPHVSVLVVTAALAGLLLRLPERGQRSPVLVQVIAVTALVALTMVFADRAAEFFGG